MGVSGYRIDLAILSEDGTQYDPGIECDGAMYHSAPAARDRDWLRQSVVEGLGWTIHRVWSTSWIRNPEGELGAIVDALEKARAGHRVREADIHSPPKDNTSQPQRELALDADDGQPPAASGPQEVQSSSLLEEYVDSDLSDVSIASHPEEDSWETLKELILRDVGAEGPVHQDSILARSRDHYGLGRAGSRVRPPINQAIATGLRQNKLDRIERDFLVLADRVEATVPRRPKPGDQPRKIEHISIEELGEALIRTVQAMYGSERRDLVVETARQLAYTRAAYVISTRLNRAIDVLLNDGSLTLAGDMLSSPRA